MTEEDARTEVDLGPGATATDGVTVRKLGDGDLEWVARIDAQSGGRRRTEFFRLKLAQAASDSGVHVSLAAEVAGRPAGFLMARVWYGEFGRAEAVAVLDSIGVDRTARRRQVGTALLAQLCRNLRALGVERVETQVAWDAWDLLQFFAGAGFRPSGAVCLALRLGDEPRPGGD